MTRPGTYRPPGAAGGRWWPVTLPGPGHDVPARVYRPGHAPHGWLVWAHGGSWRAGSAAGWHAATADLAHAAGATVVSVDYRLAPAHRHPAALTDLLAAMDWAQEHGAGPVAVGGDSAGATLAASAALVWRDRHRPLAAQVLAYPPIDPGCHAPSYHRRPHAFPGPAELAAAWRDYRGGAGRHPAATAPTPLYSTPAEATDLTGAAPAVLAVGTLDPVADDVLAYACRLRAAGTPTRLLRFPGGRHGAFLTDPAFRHRLGTAYAAVHSRETT
ncbi:MULTISPECIES: alpha/beta hydrolase fold domain-containing protein [Streptosporangium]|uniref:Acetyl esterase n=1 Tax=Streptosporangium brasiliense TaxID=47480 RepID=A0ABT9R9D1_9ACTN|nr:alpha/beta hydrolase fold domain-containing protein [Streptosporangium brasiliense]MDP9865414.1 acetyl esterase [Streptosporangium brasiliense]